MMDSDGKINQTGACCVGFTNVSSGFLIENTGNENVSLNYSCAGSCTADDFIGGTNPSFEIRTTPNYWAGQSGETSAADTDQSCRQGTAVYNWTIYNYTDVTAAGQGLCGSALVYPFSNTETNDAVVIDINVTIPEDAGDSSEKKAIFNFSVTSAG